MINKETGELHIIWCVEDIQGYMDTFNSYRDEDKQLPTPTKEQAIEILEIIEHGHDCNYGITWDSIESAMEMFYIED